MATSPAALPVGRKPLPAPWRIIEQSWPVSPGDLVLKRLIVVADDRGDVEAVALLPLTDLVGELMPTAQLVAAAPELLEVARTLLSLWEDEELRCRSFEALQALRCAIGKAEGREP